MNDFEGVLEGGFVAGPSRVLNVCFGGFSNGSRGLLDRDFGRIFTHFCFWIVFRGCFPKEQQQVLRKPPCVKRAKALNLSYF